MPVYSLRYMHKIVHISQKEFEIIKWFSIKERYNQCVKSIALKDFDNQDTII